MQRYSHSRTSRHNTISTDSYSALHHKSKLLCPLPLNYPLNILYDCLHFSSPLGAISTPTAPSNHIKKEQPDLSQTVPLQIDYFCLMYGNNNTSRIDGEFVNSMTSLSIPIPKPPVGGIPYSSASKKSSSISCASSLPSSRSCNALFDR